MAIGSLSASQYVALSSIQANAGSHTSASATNAGTIGDQLLAELAQSQSANGVTSDPLLQDLVSLSPSALGQASGAPLTYNAQGLLQQVQSSTMLNDPLFQSDATDTSGVSSNSLLQSLMAASNVSTATASPHASATAGTTASAASSQTTGITSSDVNATLAQLVQKDPALANAVLESQMEQDAISSMLG